jgi:hypothetical protein
MLPLKPVVPISILVEESNVILLIAAVTTPDPFEPMDNPL